MRNSFLRRRKVFAIGDLVPTSAIYDCSACGNGSAFKKGESFTSCDACTGRAEGQSWIRTPELVSFVSKNLNVEFKKLETFGLKLADFIADHSGRISFVVLHIIWFVYWIYVNTGHSLFGISGFDPYPFGLLTTTVSLEAIFLATFILISQNRQGVKSELRAELDYQVNLKTEKEVAELASMLREIKEEGRTIESNTHALVKDLITKIEEEKHARIGKGKKKKSHPSTEAILADENIKVLEGG